MRTNEEKHKKNGRSGFTLVEMLLVVAIIGILATVVVVNFAGRQKGAMIKATRGSISNICLALDLYEGDTGRFPASLQALISSDGAPNWKGPYIKTKDIPADAWGTSFTYSLQSDSGYEVRSAGPDLQMNTDDDITN